MRFEQAVLRAEDTNTTDRPGACDFERQWLSVEPLLRSAGCRKSFGGITAVHDHHLRRPRRGERGPGRTKRRGQDDIVQLRLWSVATTSEGDITFDGQPLMGLPTYKRARLGIGRTYQRVEVFTDMTVRDHLLVAERSRQGEGRLWRDLLN